MEQTVPQWFRDALAEIPAIAQVDVDGVPIHYRRWGSGGRTPLLLIHGGSAHAGWWDHIAPLLARDRTVVALDLSGHGDSGRRAGYDVPTWAGEAMAVVADAGLGEPVLVGHSMGGFVALSAAAAAAVGERLAGAIVVDSAVRSLTPERAAARARFASSPLRIYPAEESPRQRFRLVPAQDQVLPYVFDHIADASARSVEGGWTWKLDPAIFAGATYTPEELAPSRCRVAMLVAENGLVTAEIRAVMSDRLGGAAAVTELPDAAHQVMLDQPLALIAATRAVLAEWERDPGRW